jgi:hypothetical protein
VLVVKRVGIRETRFSDHNPSLDSTDQVSALTITRFIDYDY